MLLQGSVALATPALSFLSSPHTSLENTCRSKNERKSKKKGWGVQFRGPAQPAAPSPPQSSLPACPQPLPDVFPTDFCVFYKVFLTGEFLLFVDIVSFVPVPQKDPLDPTTSNWRAKAPSCLCHTVSLCRKDLVPSERSPLPQAASWLSRGRGDAVG